MVRQYGDLKPGDLVTSSARGMMVLSTVVVDRLIAVTWMKLWGDDGLLFAGGFAFTLITYVVAEQLPTTLSIMQRQS